MKTLVISKPIYDHILNLVEFPQDGDSFFIDESVKSVSNVGTLLSLVLAKYGMDVSYTGMIGEDESGKIIKALLEEYNIDTTYVETCYTEKTCVNYKIYNQKTNKFTNVISKSLKSGLTKYKYEFIPDTIIMDDGDYQASLAAINNYPNANLIYIGDKFTNQSKVYFNKCKYVFATLPFAATATGVTTNLNKPKNIVQLFQKYIDLYNSNLIIRLDNFDLLYCVNDEVRIIKNTNTNLKNKENLYISIIIYYLLNTNDLENSIKLTNKVVGLISNELDMVKNIPEYRIVKEILDDTIEKINISNNQSQTNTNVVTNNATQVIENNIVNNQNAIQSNNVIQEPIQNNNVNNLVQNQISNNTNIISDNTVQMNKTVANNIVQVSEKNLNNQNVLQNNNVVQEHMQKNVVEQPKLNNQNNGVN